MLSDLEPKMKKVCDMYGFSIEEATNITGSSEKHVSDIERLYDIAFPTQYREFLVKYGYWFLAFQVLGIAVLESGELSFESMDMTNLKKTKDFPVDYLIIENIDEYQYCLNLKDGSIGSWERYDGTMIPKYDDFFSYLEDNLDMSIDNAPE